MTVNSQRLLLAAAGAGGAAAAGLYVDDVFSTFLYTGTDATHTITNGIDLDGEGGLVWIKGRSNAFDHRLFDTERGASKFVSTNTTGEEAEDTVSHTGFNSDGFTLGTRAATNGLNFTFCSWTFRKAPGFFDVVTYTGNSTAGRTVSHNLGSVPGVIIVKNLSTPSNWAVFHRSLGATKVMELNSNDDETTSSAYWNDTAPTSTNFTLGSLSNVNGSGENYIAYLFAHDDQSFGANGDEAIIKCGSFTTNSSSEATVNVGFEPQWFLIKSSSVNDSWYLFDTMRGFTVETDYFLQPNTSDAESTSSISFGYPTATGWSNVGDTSQFFANSDYIYIAIRRPHKPPEAASDVFGVVAGANEPSNSSGGGELTSASGVLADLILHRPRKSSSGNARVCDRLRGNSIWLNTTATSTESDASSIFGGYWKFDRQDQAYIPGPGYFNNTTSNTPYVVYSFTRAPGFFDVVAYTGTGSATTVNHSLGAVPSVVLIKGRDTNFQWYWQHYALGANTWMQLNKDEEQASNGTLFNSTLPTSSVFSVGSLAGNNGSGNDYIAYLFGDLDGISKAGTYTGTGGNVGVDCGFTAGARFVLIKRTDSSGDWYYFDSSRGIVGGNDPYLLVNTNAAEVTNTDYIDPLNSGFTVTSSAPADLNASGGTYLFLAIA